MGRVLHRLVVVLLAGIFLLPLLWMVSISLMPEGEGLVRPPIEAWSDPQWQNYGRALAPDRMGDVPRLFWNTTLLTVICVIGQCLTCSLAGYAFACLRFPGRDMLFVLVLATMMLPPQVTTIPQFILFRELGLIDTFQPLILPCVLGGAPFFIFLFRQAFLSLPRDLMDAARMDGCGPFRTWLHVHLPLVRPMLATVALFTFLATWNDFWAPLIYLTSAENRTLALALAAFNRSYNVAAESMMAAAGVVLLPCVVVYFLVQRLYVRGISVAASKR
jgi:ABC-type glycerol-3-phosphate transport system permease component